MHRENFLTNLHPTKSQSYEAEAEIQRVVQIPNVQQVPVQQVNIEPQAVIQTSQVATTIEASPIQAQSGQTPVAVDKE